MNNYIYSGRVLLGSLRDGVYDILPFLQPGLMIDCGAAVGGITAKMRKNSPQSRVLAFEPFPGNHLHFESRHGSDCNVVLFKAAVGAKKGKASFFTPSVVRAPARVKATPGASFVGRLDETREPDGNKVIEIDVYRLDDVCNEPVRFLKIDVQGGEIDVLAGASRLLGTGSIDLVYIEIMQEPELLRMLVESGFLLFDTEYIVAPKAEADLTGWDKVDDRIISTGQAAFRGWPNHAPNDIESYAEWIAAEGDRTGRVSTDLVAVRPDYLPVFLKACAEAIERAHKNDGASG